MSEEDKVIKNNGKSDVENAPNSPLKDSISDDEPEQEEEEEEPATSHLRIISDLADQSENAKNSHHFVEIINEPKTGSMNNITEQRPKSRQKMSKYSTIGYWKALKVTFYKNGDPYFPGLEMRFRPGRDVVNLETLLDKLSLRLDLSRGARYIFSMDGDRKYDLDELEDGASYVVSSFKGFKAVSYGKKNGLWNVPNPHPVSSWSRTTSRKSSLVDMTSTTDDVVNNFTHPTSASGSGAAAASGGGGGSGLKPTSGRVIRIINSSDHACQCRVLLNLRTSQPFEEVLDDLGQVLKMHGARRMLTLAGQEVRSFSQLRNEFADIDTFYLSNDIVPRPISRSRSRVTHSALLVEDLSKNRQQRRSRSKSRPRALYAPEPELLDYAPPSTSLVEILKDEPVKVTIKGYRRTFYPPNHHAPIDNSPPDKKLTLKWVFGYRGSDTKRNLWVLPTGELLYYVAAIAVMFDREEDAQRHYCGHTEDILCMDLHPSKELVASGQKGGRNNRKTQAHIRIWSTQTLQTLYVFGMGEFDLGIVALAFSFLNGGSYVMSIDAGAESILSVWQWQWGHLLGKVATLEPEITGAVFHPLDDNLMITYGRGHLTFWTRRKDGFFERTDILKPPSATLISSLQFEQDGDVITGDSDGFVTVYSVDADGAYFVRMEFDAHNKGVGAVMMLSEGTLLTGGDKDRRICAWDSLQNYKKITEVKLSESFGGIRSIYPQRPGRNDGNIYVGTVKNNILEGSLQRRFNQLVFGHARQLWGLTAHPDNDIFATAGHDKSVALWKKNQLVWTTQVSFECVSLTFHPFGVALVTGTVEGHLFILNSDTGQLSNSLRVCGSALNCITFNPTGELIAVASQNGSVYLFRVSRDGFAYKKSNKIRGAQPLAQIDWSNDSSYLRTVTLDYDLLFWDVKLLTAEKNAIAMKDVKWHTQNVTVGYLINGIWQNRFYPSTMMAAASSLVSTVSRSNAHDLLIVGDTDGYLRLFRYPCLSQKAEYNEQKVYSGTVTCARFLSNDRSVVTVGGHDAALMLWQLSDDDE